MSSHKPNLDLARQFTRDLGPAAIGAGGLIVLHGVVLQILQSPFADFFVLAYGMVMVVFGAAAYVRTESIAGQLLRWVVVLVFAFGGGLSLWQWAVLIFGTRVGAVQGDLTMMGFYLMAGPALLVPAGLAAVRPGWVPLIVVPAIVSLASASVLGHGVILILKLLVAKTESASPLPDIMLLTGVVLTSMALVLYSGFRGVKLTRTTSQ